MAVVLEGTYAAHIAVVWLDRRSVERMLPSPLACGPLDDRAHPVVFAFGEQQRVRPRGVRARGMRYREVIVGVPAVRARGGEDPSETFTFLPRLFLDHRGATALGVLAGFAKRVARVHHDGGCYEVRERRSGRLLLEATFAQDGGELPFEASTPLARSPVRTLLARPILNRTVAGTWVTCTMDWGLAGARVASADATLRVHDPIVPGLDPGAYDVRGIDAGALGAWRMTNDWTLTLPRHVAVPPPRAAIDAEAAT